MSPALSAVGTRPIRQLHSVEFPAREMGAGPASFLTPSFRVRLLLGPRGSRERPASSALRL